MHPREKIVVYRRLVIFMCRFFSNLRLFLIAEPQIKSTYPEATLIIISLHWITQLARTTLDSRFDSERKQTKEARWSRAIFEY
jgi:hypothetical protein